MCDLTSEGKVKKQCNWGRCQIRSVSRVKKEDISQEIVTITKIPIEEEDQDKIEEEEDLEEEEKETKVIKENLRNVINAGI